MNLVESGRTITTIAVLLLCRDAFHYLGFLLPALAALERHYDCAFEYHILENGSRDHTLAELAAFMDSRAGRIIVPGGTSQLDRLPRVERIARLRNTLAESVRPLRSDVVLMIDMDVYFDTSVLGRLLALDPTANGLAMVCAFGIEVIPTAQGWATQGHYYDTLAFVPESGHLTWPNCLFEDCDKCRDATAAFVRATPGFVRPGRPPLLKVISAFGGFALVDSACFNHAGATWRTALFNGLDLCEHIHFCRELTRLSGRGIAVAGQVPVAWDRTDGRPPGGAPPQRFPINVRRIRPV